MQGRLLQLQEQPFEVQTHNSGAAALRCNFDVQDLRRVLPDHLWKPDDATYPSLHVDESRAKEMVIWASMNGMARPSFRESLGVR